MDLDSAFSTPAQTIMDSQETIRGLRVKANPKYPSIVVPIDVFDDEDDLIQAQKEYDFACEKEEFKAKKAKKKAEAEEKAKKAAEEEKARKQREQQQADELAALAAEVARTQKAADEAARKLRESTAVAESVKGMEKLSPAKSSPAKSTGRSTEVREGEGKKKEKPKPRQTKAKPSTKGSEQPKAGPSRLRTEEEVHWEPSRNETTSKVVDKGKAREEPLGLKSVLQVLNTVPEALKPKVVSSIQTTVRMGAGKSQVIKEWLFGNFCDATEELQKSTEREELAKGKSRKGVALGVTHIFFF